jgi:phosphatidylinositol-3-phosphatase
VTNERAHVRPAWLTARSVTLAAAAAAMIIAIAACGSNTASTASSPGVSPSLPNQAPASPSPASPSTPSAASSHGATSAQSVPPRPDHVVIVIFENKGYGSQVGSPSAPYLNSVLANSAVFTNARAITHPSQPNYLALFSGSIQGVTSDRCLTPFHNRSNLGSQLIAAGETFTGYSEDLPSVGYTGCSNGDYAAKHNPWAHFDNVPASANQPYSAFPRDFSKLPTVSFVVPNLCNDMHDCGTTAGDRWARANLAPYLAWAGTHNSLLLITYDENDGSAGNHILTAFAGAGVRPGRYSEAVDHYRILRTIEAMYHLSPIGNAAQTAPITDIWR